jgi:hypothetical protein
MRYLSHNIRMNKIDLENKRFGKLTCLTSESNSKTKSVIWNCKCDCGNEKKFTASNLIRGHCKSCGCLGNISDTQRFFKHIKKKKNGCWEWTGQLHKTGYGRFLFQGKRGFLSHRVSWIIHKGDIIDNLFVCHHCDNRKCVNPDHLFLGTNNDNIQDRTLKNRSNRPFGNKFTPRKINERQVKEIKKFLGAGISRKKISEIYNISIGQVTKISLGIRWKHVK